MYDVEVTTMNDIFKLYDIKAPIAQYKPWYPNRKVKYVPPGDQDLDYDEYIE
jgi:hypothetical protein